MGGVIDSVQESNHAGDAKGALRGTKIIKNIPTFKIEHWNNIELKLPQWVFSKIGKISLAHSVTPCGIEPMLIINTLQRWGRKGGLGKFYLLVPLTKVLKFLDFLLAIYIFTS